MPTLVRCMLRFEIGGSCNPNTHRRCGNLIRRIQISCARLAPTPAQICGKCHSLVSNHQNLCSIWTIIITAPRELFHDCTKDWTTFIGSSIHSIVSNSWNWYLTLFRFMGHPQVARRHVPRFLDLCRVQTVQDWDEETTSFMRAAAYPNDDEICTPENQHRT